MQRDINQEKNPHETQNYMLFLVLTHRLEKQYFMTHVRGVRIIQLGQRHRGWGSFHQETDDTLSTSTYRTVLSERKK